MLSCSQTGLLRLVRGQRPDRQSRMTEVEPARSAQRLANRTQSMFLDPDFDLPDAWSPVSPAGCRHWKVGVADPAQHQPVRSSIPTLVLAGEYDGAVTPLVVRQIPPALRRSFSNAFPAAPTSSSPTATRSAPAPARSPVSSSTRPPDGPTPDASTRFHGSTSRLEPSTHGGPGRPRTCDRRIMSEPSPVRLVMPRSIAAGQVGSIVQPVTSRPPR